MTRASMGLCMGGAMLLAASVSGCKKEAAPAQPTEAPAGAGAAVQVAAKVSEAARAEARQIYAMRCTPCHGQTGEGNGPASATLNPKPRNFRDAAWQKGVTNEHIDKIIQFGGAAVGKSAAMPPNPDLNSKPEVVTALREHIRGLGK